MIISFQEARPPRLSKRQNSKRSRIEIIADILQALPDKQTRISGRANLSWNIVVDTLNYLLLKGLIRRDFGEIQVIGGYGGAKKGAFYSLTLKGEEALQHYHAYIKALT